MRVMPVVYTADVAAMRRFYETSACTPPWPPTRGGWVSLTAAPGSGLGLHRDTAGDPPRAAGHCELSFEADEPLTAVLARLAAGGYDAAVVDESFGQSIRVVGPDGVTLQINEAMTDPYGYTAVDPSVDGAADGVTR